MHILFLTDNFPPEGNAPATRTYEHAIRWVESGHKVTVITGAPNFPEGKLFDGYENRWYHRSEMDGIDVVRVKTFISSNEGFALRIIDFTSFMVSSFFAGLLQKKPDVIVATSPQFFTAVSGWLLSVFRRKPYVFELRDIWPASIKAVGAMGDSLAIRMLEKLELFLYRRAARIISVTHSFKSELISRGIEGNKIDVVVNGVDLNSYSPVTEKDPELAIKWGLEDTFVLGYIGTHGMAHALEKVIEAAELLKDRQDIVILFVGGGAAKAQLVELTKEKQLTNVVFVDRQPKALIPRIWSLCDASLISLRDTPLFQTVIPSKIFESMGMGLPVLATMPQGEASEIIETHGCGMVVEPESASSLAKAITEMTDNTEQRLHFAKASAAAAPTYSRDKLAADMLTNLDKIT